VSPSTVSNLNKKLYVKHASTIGLDLAKHVFQVHGADDEGSPMFNRKLRRSEVLRFFEKLPHHAW
jgi:transposase